jgi:hypothetical protein
VLLESVGKQIDDVEKEVVNLMKGHWVDTANAVELDRLGHLLATKRMGDEKDKHFRARLKRALNEYKGGGTVQAIKEILTALVGVKTEEDVEIIENPRVEASTEVKVVAGDTWMLGSNSISDEQSSLALAVEEKGQVSNPEIMNVDNGETIAFKGKLRSGEQLVIKDDKAFIGERDVTDCVSPTRPPLLLRKGSNWKYSEALLEKIAVFDTARFDEHTFAVHVPTVTIRLDWMRSQPATFLVRIKSRALRESGLAESYIEGVVNSLKASGVNALIEATGK